MDFFQMATLYETLGGKDAVNAAVEGFYRKMLADMDGQVAKQAAFMTMVLGGPNEYTGKDMREGHKPLLEKGLNDSHVDIVTEHLGATLKELGVGDAEIQQVADLANSVRDDVLNR